MCSVEFLESVDSVVVREKGSEIRQLFIHLVSPSPEMKQLSPGLFSPKPE